MECPECKKKHKIVNDVRTFRQNPYILNSLHAKLEKAKLCEDTGHKEMTKYEDQGQRERAKCEEHGDELTLLCKKSECQKIICRKCLKYHREHDAVDLEEEEQKEELATKVETTLQNLEKRKGILMAAPAVMTKLHDRCIQLLEANEEQCVQLVRERFESLKNSVEEQKMKTHNDIAKDCLHQHQGHLNNIKKNVEGAEGEIAAREDIASNRKIVNSIEESLDEDVSLTKSYDYFEYSPSLDRMKGLVEVLCDQLVEKKKEIVAIAEIPTTLVDDKVLVVLGDKDNKRVVTKYGILSADSGRELGSVDVKRNASGLTEVMLGRKPCVAISYW